MYSEAVYKEQKQTGSLWEYANIYVLCRLIKAAHHTAKIQLQLAPFLLLLNRFFFCYCVCEDKLS